MKKKSIGSQSPKVAVQLLDNSEGKIIASPKEFQRIYHYMSVPVEGAKFSKAFRSKRWDGSKHFVTNRGYFKIGLFYKIVEFLEDNNIRYRVEDLRVPLEYTFRSIGGLGDKEFRTYQRKAIAYALDSEVYGVPYPRGILATATNSGKTLMAAGIYASVTPRQPFLFLVHRQEIFDQAVSTFGKLFPKEAVGRYSADECSLENCTIGMVSTLAARIKTKDAKAILSYYKILVVDEAHHGSAATWTKVIDLSDAYIKIALSGSALELDEGRNLTLIGLFGPVIYEFRNKDMVKEKYSAKPDVRLIEYDQSSVTANADYRALNDKITRLIGKKTKGAAAQRQELKRQLYALTYKLGIVESVSRNRAIVDVVSGWVDRSPIKGKSILIVVTQIEHGELLHQWLNDCGIPTVFVSGQSDREVRRQVYKDFAGRKIQTLIATMIYKEGVDIEGIDTLIIACGGKSAITVLQFVGRGLRKSPGKNTIPVYDFKDLSHSTLKKHSMLRRKIYEREEFTVREGTTAELTPTRVEGTDLWPRKLI